MPVQKYYAIARGRTPGVYTSWEKAKAQVLRFEGSLYKSFMSEAEAFGYMKRNMPPEAYQDLLKERATPKVPPTLPKIEPRQVPKLAPPTAPSWLASKAPQTESRERAPEDAPISIHSTNVMSDTTTRPARTQRDASPDLPHPRDASPARAEEKAPRSTFGAQAPPVGVAPAHRADEGALCFYISGAHTQGATYVGIHTVSLGEPLADYCIATRAQLRSNPTPERCQLYGARVAVEIAKHLCMEEFTIYFGALSNTVVHTINAWMHKWAANNWSSGHGDGKLPNLDLVRPLYDSIAQAKLRPQAHSALANAEEIELARQYAAVLMNSEKLHLIGLF